MTARPLPTRRSLFLPLALALTMTAAALGAVKPGGGKKSLPAKPGAPRTPAAGKQKSPPPTGALSVNKGEIRLDGTIRTVDVAAMTLELEAVSYTLASGKTVRFPQPVSRAVLLAPGAALFVRDAPGRAVPVTELRAGLSAIAVGPKATPLAARQVAVWSREEAGKFVFDAGTPAPPPATSKNAPPPLTLSLDQVKPPPPPPADRPVLVPGTGHGSRVGFVRFLPGERILLTSGGDGTLKLWDVKSGRLKSTFRPGPDKLWAVDLSPDGSLAAYGGSDGKIGLWDPHAGHLLRTLSAMWGLTAGAFSPDGKRLALAGEQGVVEMWDTETGSRLKSWPNGPEKVRAAALAYSPDGTTLAVSGGDGQIRLWDPKTGHLRQTLTGQSAPRTLAYSPDGKLLASLSDAPAAWKNEGQEDSGRKDLGIEIRLWNPVSGELLRSWGVPGAGWFNGLGFSPDGKTLVVGGVEATMWDPRTGQPKGSLTGHPLTTAVAFSADGKTIVTGSAGSAILSELRPGAPGKLTFGDRDITGPLAFDPRGKLLAQGTEGGRINLWDPQRGRLVRRIDGEFPALGLLQFSPDGSRLLACSWANEAHVRDVATGRLLFRLENISRVHAAAFSPDGKTIASAGGVLRIWDARSGKLLRTVEKLSGGVGSLTYTPDGQQLLGALENGTVGVWNARTGERERELGKHATPLSDVACSPDGKLVASCGGDLQVLVHDLASGAVQAVIRINQGSTRVAFLPDSDTLLIAGFHGLVACQLRSREVRLLSPFFWDTSLAVSPDGQRVASADGRDTRLWDPSTGRLLAHLIPVPDERGRRGATPQWLAATSEGYYDCSESADRVVFWRFEDRYVPFSAFEESYRDQKLVLQSLQGKPVPKPLTNLRVSPQVQVSDPKPETVLSGSSARLTVRVTDDRGFRQKEAAFTVSVNGVPVPASAVAVEGLQLQPLAAGTPGAPKEHKVSARLQLTVSLPPGERECRVRVEAYDDENNRGDATVTVLRPSEPEVRGDLYLLCVGVSKYKNPAYDLKYAAKDASALAEALASQKGKRYVNVHTSLLTDSGATVAGVRAALQRLSAVKAEDTVLLFFSGHGLTDGSRFYFAPHEVVAKNLETVRQSCLPWSEVVDALAGTPAGRKLLLTDACHSGGKLTTPRATGDDFAGATRRTGIVMLASSRGDQLSFEDDALGHGAFTQALLEALAGKATAGAAAAAGAVTLKQVLEYVPERVATLTKDSQTPWVPQLEEFNLEVPLALLSPAEARPAVGQEKKP